MNRSLSVVVSTYERPSALDLVLRALREQSDDSFDIVVADDGSGPETADVVRLWQRELGENRLRHSWHEDAGFRLALARNRGAASAAGEFLVFLDGDCVPRRHFVRAMRRSARPGWYVAGRRVELSEALTDRVLSERAPLHRWPVRRWWRLRNDAVGLHAFTPRDRRRVGARRLPEFEPVNRAFGFLFGVWREDFERVNGYDSRFVGWGEEDVDLAMRLHRLGLRCGHAGVPATVLHLWHPPREATTRPNWELLGETERARAAATPHGLREVRRAGDHEPATIER